MRKMKILSIYLFATIGGVERVLLNRAISFKQMRIAATIDAYFLTDYGGLSALRSSIELYNLHDYIRVIERPVFEAYDAFLVIDTPEIFRFLPNRAKLIVECHSSRFIAQRYLTNLPEHTHAVVAPSESLKKQVEGLVQIPVTVVPNRVPAHDSCYPPRWSDPLMFYAGRIEEGKNVNEAIGVFASCHQTIPDLRLLIITPSKDYSNVINIANKLNISKNIFFRSGSNFYETSCIYATIAQSNAIFISSSLHETWGLSAAEALANKIPVILSKNSGHVEVVADDSDFIYTSRHISEAKEKAISSLQGKNSVKLEGLQKFHTNIKDSVERLVDVLNI